jgi:hypothetical protein
VRCRPCGVIEKLYYALDRWLQLCDRGSGQVNSRRRKGVYDAYVAVVEQLSSEVGVPVNLLPGWLTATFGRAMEEHGVNLDLQRSLAKYYTRAELEKFRLDFHAGIAYQQDFLRNRTRMILADSRNINPGDSPIRAGFSGYVCGLNGDFYSGPHMVPQGTGDGLYHSSYLGGGEVLCAGEIKLENGRVTEINNDSGHYKPPVRNVVMAVEMLALHGVNLAALMVSGHGIARSNGEQFLKVHSALAVPALPARPGATAVSAFQQRSTVNHHDARQREALAFALLKEHNKPKTGRHSWAKRDKCDECKQYQDLWHVFIERVNKEQKGALRRNS